MLGVIDRSNFEIVLLCFRGLRRGRSLILLEENSRTHQEHKDHKKASGLGYFFYVSCKNFKEINHASEGVNFA